MDRNEAIDNGAAVLTNVKIEDEFKGQEELEPEMTAVFLGGRMSTSNTIYACKRHCERVLIMEWKMAEFEAEMDIKLTSRTARDCLAMYGHFFLKSISTPIQLPGRNTFGV